MKKLLALALALTAVCSMGAELRTQNFIVIAANPQVCQSVAQAAEKYRREKAIQWLGREMPQWSEPCPLHVTVAFDGPKGETEFSFNYGRVSSMRMKIYGPLDRLLNSVLPHEITHTVFANHFKTPVPRWADEGGSVLSEDDLERDRHDKLVRSILNKGQQVPLRTLFSVKEYGQAPVMCLYAQGFSVSDYLVKRSNRQHFLNFVGHGMQHGWDAASKSYFGHNSVEELEQAWLQHLRDTKSRPQEAIFAANTNTNPPGNGAPTYMGTQSGRTVRLTLPPTQPPATTRGAMPTPDQPIMRPGQTQWEPGVRLEPPVPDAPLIPRIPPISAVQAGWPR